MQPWRRELVEQGLTIAWLAERTGRSANTVQAYSDGRRNPPAAWIVEAHEVIAAEVARQEKGEAA
jgi:hypothetical protein